MSSEGMLLRPAEGERDTLGPGVGAFPGVRVPFDCAYGDGVGPILIRTKAEFLKE